MNEDPESTDKRRICRGCIGEAYLRDHLEWQSTPDGGCHYCDETDETVALTELADWIDAAFAEHYEQTPTEPEPIEERDNWERRGQRTTLAIQEASEIDVGPAEDVRRILEARHYDRHSVKAGEETPFDDDAHYELKEPDDFDLDLDWQNLEHDLKTGTRFFSRIATIAFETIFGSLDRLAREDGSSILVTAGPNETVNRFFRARVFTTRTELEAALARPDLELAPPPARRARNGRMNPQGIAVFYGATTEQAALDEVRPPVGSHVLSGQFVLRHPVTLLDITAFENVFTEGSVFDPGHINRRRQAVFFAKLIHRVAKPVMPDDEPLEYLTTQAMAEYLSQLDGTQIDGLLYPSAQSKSRGQNVALFHRCSRTEELISLAAKISRVSPSYDDEAFFVTSESATPPPPTPQGDAFLDLMTPMDHRECFLTLDLESLKLHRVRSIEIETKEVLIFRSGK